MEDYVMRNGLRTFLLVLLALGVCAVPVFAQTGSTGSLSGTILDPKGAVVAGASMTVVSKAPNQEFTAQTSEDGIFTIPTINPGCDYDTFSYSRFILSLCRYIHILFTI